MKLIVLVMLIMIMNNVNVFHPLRGGLHYEFSKPRERMKTIEEELGKVSLTCNGQWNDRLMKDYV